MQTKSRTSRETFLQSDIKRLQLPGGTSNQEPSATKEFNDGTFFKGELKSVKAKLAKLEDEMKMAEVEFRRKANSDPCWSAKADELKAKAALVSDCLTEVRGLLSIVLDVKGTNDQALIDLRKGVEDAANHEKAARAVMKGIKALLEALKLPLKVLNVQLQLCHVLGIIACASHGTRYPLHTSAGVSLRLGA